MNRTNNNSIPVATQQSYSATANGAYAVMVTMNGCSDTSACMNVSAVDIHQLSTNKQQLIAYPNPNEGSFKIKSINSGVYSIINELGQTLQSFKLNVTNNNTATIENLSTGIYFIVGFNNNQMTKQKVVIMK